MSTIVDMVNMVDMVDMVDMFEMADPICVCYGWHGCDAVCIPAFSMVEIL